MQCDCVCIWWMTFMLNECRNLSTQWSIIHLLLNKITPGNTDIQTRAFDYITWTAETWRKRKIDQIWFRTQSMALGQVEMRLYVNCLFPESTYRHQHINTNVKKTPSILPRYIYTGSWKLSTSPPLRIQQCLAIHLPYMPSQPYVFRTTKIWDFWWRGPL